MPELRLDIFRLHPQGCRIVPSEKTLNGTANPAGVKWCGPFTNANKMGWWVFSPVDMDIIYKGQGIFEYKILEPYDDFDYDHIRQLIKPEDGVDPDKWSHPGGRTKFTWGAVEEDVVQIWMGVILKTPKDWCLQVRSPVNCGHGQPFHVQEGILETDWMQYDIWINLKFHKKGRWAALRKETWPPIAQLIPVPRSSVDPKWAVSEKMVNRDDPESEAAFKYWIEYNRKKYESGGKQMLTAENPNLTKDSTTYWRERQEALKCPMGH